MALTTLTACLIYPILICIYACKSRNKDWNKDEVFMQRFGVFFDGMRSDNDEVRLASILLTMAFYVRRIVLSISLVFMQNFFWGQIVL